MIFLEQDVSRIVDPKWLNHSKGDSTISEFDGSRGYLNRHVNRLLNRLTSDYFDVTHHHGGLRNKVSDLYWPVLVNLLWPSASNPEVSRNYCIIYASRNDQLPYGICLYQNDTDQKAQ